SQGYSRSVPCPQLGPVAWAGKPSADAFVCQGPLPGPWPYRLPTRTCRESPSIGLTHIAGAVAIEPSRDRCQRRVRQIAFQQTPDARDKVEVARLAITPPQTHEYADNLGVPLRAKRSVIGEKLVAVHAGFFPIMIEHYRFQFLRNIAPG